MGCGVRNECRIHDFYFEGDYWWPDPENPHGPYIQHNGMSNPGNFTEHRKAMIRLSQIFGLWRIPSRCSEHTTLESDHGLKHGN